MMIAIMSGKSYTRLERWRWGDFLDYSKWRLTKRVVFLATIFLTLLFFFHSLLLQQTIRGFKIAIPTDLALSSAVISPGERKLVILLPSDDSSPNLCKVISSAVALGYPAPIIVNFQRDFNTEEDGVGPSQLAKITGTLNYLEWASSDDAPEEDRLGGDDLVLMLDAYDVWFQLPPSVLLQRYFQSNERANRRLRRENGFFNEGLMQQRIIISAQKGCMSPRDSVSKPHCEDLPESTLPPDVYGFFTDNWKFKWRYMRPRYLNSGSFMGPVSDMKRYFQRVKEKMDLDLLIMTEDQELGGDQGIFAEVLGEQELWRQQVTLEHSERGVNSREGPASRRSEFEYHLGLDYTQELFYPTCYSEVDGYFVPLNDSKAVEYQSSSLGVSPPRIQGIPKDLQEATNPLAKVPDIPEEEKGWGVQPLYADFWTTAVPAVLHHNAWKHGLKSRRTTWWDKMWFFPYLRALLEAHSKPGINSAPLTTIQAGNGSLTVYPYGDKEGKRKPLLFKKNLETNEWGVTATEWKTVCRHDKATTESKPWYDEVFRDDQGAFSS